MIKKTEIELMNLLIYIVSFIAIYSVYIATSDTVIGTAIAVIVGIGLYYGVIKLKEHHSSISMNLVKKKFRIVPLMFLVGTTIIIEYGISSTLPVGISGNQKRVMEEIKGAPIHETLLSNVIKAPIVEEIVFRGFILLICLTIIHLLLKRVDITKRSKNIVTALTFTLLSAISFGAAHMTEGDSVIQLLPYVISGLIFAFIYIVTQNIITSMVVHGVGNLIATCMGLSQYHLIPFNLGVYIFIGVGVVLAVLLLIMWVQYLDYIADYKDEKKEITSLVKDEIFEKITFG